MDLPGLAMGLQMASAAAGLLCCLVAFGAIILRRGAAGDTQKVRIARRLVQASLFSLTAYAGSVTTLAALQADGTAGLAPGAALLPEALLTHGGLVALLLATAVLLDKRMVPSRNARPGARLRISLVLPALALASWSALTGLAVASTSTVVPATAVYASTAVLWAMFLAGGATVAHLHRSSGGTPRGAHPARPGAPQPQHQQRPPHPQVIPFPRSPAMQPPPPQAHRSMPRIAASPPEQVPAPVTASEVAAHCRPALIGVAGISLVTNLLMLTGPLYMLQVYDRVLTSRSIETLIALTLVLVVLYAAMSMLEHIRAKVLARIAVRIDRLLAPHLLASALSARQTKAEGTHATPLRDLDTVRQFVSGPAPGAMFDLPWTPLYFGIIFLMHPLLGLVALGGAAVLWSLSLLNETVTRKPMAEAAEGMARGHTLAETGKRDAETLHAMGMIGTFRKRWIADHTQVLSKQVAAADTANGYAVATRVSRLLLQSLVLAMGAYLTLYDLVSPGAMIAASIITARALAPVEQLVAQWRGVIAARAAFARCRERLDDIETPPSRIDLPVPRGYLSVANLFITAGNRKEPVLKGLRFALEPGQALAVIGASASGKSTLARALVGVAQPRHGEIRLDGAMLDQWEPETLGRYVGYLPQEVRLLDGTIAENIARFATNPDGQAVLEAAAQAGVHDMILRLPQGYATLVGEGGAALSGGQRQRIALARALYGNPPLVVMDEPNSNLDTDGDTALAAAIERIRLDGRTAVVMAHRKSVLAAVTHILVLKDGRQAAFGTVDQILQRKPAGKTGEKANVAHRRAESGRIGA